jgi:hypothetical protein
MEQAARKGKPGIVTGLAWRMRVSNRRIDGAGLL